MIFGFNTEVKLGEVAYHVQSEAREKDLLLQTQVFVKGRCVGKRATSYAARAAEPGFSEEQMHELLKQQHKIFVNAARENRIEPFLRTDLKVEDVGGGLALEWANFGSPASDSATLRLIVTDGGQAVPGAQIVVRTAVAGDALASAEAVTDVSGSAEIRVPLDSAAPEQALFVLATGGGKSATRKIRIKRN